jgi:hypothetical protein
MESAVKLLPSKHFRVPIGLAKCFAAAAVVVLASSLISLAAANTITFETASLGAGINSPVTENGFTYSTLSGSLSVTPFGNPGHDAEGLQSSGGGVLKIVSATGDKFNFNSLDFAAFDFSGNGSQTLRVEGFSEASSVGVDQYTLANTNIFDPKYANWTTEAASALAGKSLSELDIALDASNAGGSISNENIDNVVLTPLDAAIPEPSSLLLLGVAMVGASFILGSRTRRSIL